MRLFTGIALPPDITAALQAAVRPLKPLAPLSWTREPKLHITIKFIGEWPPARLAELQTALAAVAISRPVDIRIAGWGWLPSGLYAAVDSTEPLRTLAQATETALEPLGIAREQRAYLPHVTLARLPRKDPPPLAPLQAELKRAPLELPPFRAASFLLYLSRDGDYTKLNEFPLPAA
jgi:2'-5' RNA ligase